MKIKNIVFDLGGVLIDWNPMYVFEDLIEDEQRRLFFFEEVCPSHWNENQDAGYPLAQATADRIALFPAFEKEIKAYYGRWVEMLGYENKGTVAILKYVIEDPNYKVLALTNWSAETFPIAKSLPRFSFLHWFEGVVVSGEEMTRKPFHDIYHILLNRYNLKAEETVFIDDNYHNVLAANELGIIGLHFISPNQLKIDLENIGVEIK